MTPTDSQVLCCLFCYRAWEYDDMLQENWGSNSNYHDNAILLQQQFFILLKRHQLKHKLRMEVQDLIFSSSSKVTEQVKNVLLPCLDCFQVLQSFCSYYKEIETLEMKLEWRLWTLSNIVSCSEKVKVRRKQFQEKYEQNMKQAGCSMEDANEVMSNLGTLRNELVTKCSQNTHVNYPTLKLKKCDQHKPGLPEEARKPSEDKIVNADAVSENSLVSEDYVGMDQNQEDNDYVDDISGCNSSAGNFDDDDGSGTSPDTKIDLETTSSRIKIEMMDETFAKLNSNDTFAKVKDEDLPDITDKNNDNDIVCEVTPGSQEAQQIGKSNTGEVEVSEISLTDHAQSDTCSNTKVELSSQQKEKEHPLITFEPVLFIELPDDLFRVEPSNSSSESTSHLNTVDTELQGQKDVKEKLEKEKSTVIPKVTDALSLRKNKRAKAISSGDNETESIVETPPSRRVSLRKRIKCHICSKTFASEASLEKHVKSSCENTVDSENEDENQSCEKTKGNDDLEWEDHGSVVGSEAESLASNENCSLTEMSNVMQTNDQQPNKEVKSCEKRTKRTSLRFENHKSYFMQSRYECSVTDCKFVFYNQEDSDIHSKLHGEFQCNFCDVKEIYAPQLSLHELQHKTGNAEKLEKQKKSSFDCSRCEYKCDSKDWYIKHHLEKHMKLSANTFSCPVCKKKLLEGKDSKNPAKSLLDHYKTHHDLTFFPSSEVERCDTEGCSAFFKTTVQLAWHKLYFHLDRSTYSPNQCLTCGRKFMNFAVLKKHRAKYHGANISIPCIMSECTETFITQVDMYFHVISDHGTIKTYWCKICMKKFKKKKNLLKHDQTEHNSENVSEQFKCSFTDCSRTLDKKENLEYHLCLHGEFKCSFCDVVKNFAPDLSVHELTHCRIDELQVKPGFTYCPRCYFSTKCKQRYISHHLRVHVICGLVQYHPGRRLLRLRNNRCGVCKEPITGIGGDQHYISHHDLTGVNPSSVFRCGEANCDAYFLKERQLQKHKGLIHRKNPFQCSYCDKVLASYPSLGRHQVSQHNVNLKYTCKFDGCGKRFVTELSQKFHVSNCGHGNKVVDDPVICAECGKTFKNAGILRNHVKKYHESPKDPKPNLVCSQCAKTFSNRHKLEIHYLSHSGPSSWQFTCGSCGKKCMSLQKLKEHENTHSKTKRFTCEECGQQYAHRHNFRHHLKKVHDVTLTKPRRKIRPN